jgi:hypothetical protein
MEPALKKVLLWIKSVALVATRLQQLQPVIQPLQPLAQVRMMNIPARLFSLGINSTATAILCQRDKAQYRKGTKPRYQAKKTIPSDGFFFAPDIPDIRDPRVTGAGERHLPVRLLSFPTAYQRSYPPYSPCLLKQTDIPR